MTYTLVKWRQRTTVGDILSITLLVVSHAGDGLVTSAAGKAFIQDPLDGAAEEVAALVEGIACALLRQGRSHASRGQQDWSGKLHLSDLCLQICVGIVGSFSWSLWDLFPKSLETAGLGQKQTIEAKERSSRS